MLKRLLILAAFMLIAYGLSAQSSPPNMIIGYSISGSNCTAPCVPATFDQWFNNQLQLIVSSGTDNLTSYLLPGTMWPSYIDGCCIDAYQIYQFIYGTAVTQGFADPEGLLLHMKADYTVGTTYAGIDQFDAYEQPGNTGGNFGNSLLARDGVFTLVGSTYTDKSVQAYCPATSCSSYTPAPFAVSDRLLIGLQIPFDIVNFTINTGRVGGTATYQYWNGSAFATLTTASDSTSGLTTTGTITFLPPSAWAPSIQHSSQSKYWIQVTISGAGTNPIVGRIYGD